jgi:hypothetical protein
MMQKKPDDHERIIGIKGQYLQKCHIQEGALKRWRHGYEKGKEARKPQS